MDFASSVRAADKKKIKWKEVVTKSSVVSRRPCKVMGWDRIEQNGKYSRVSLSRLRLSRTTTYLEEKIWSMFKSNIR